MEVNLSVKTISQIRKKQRLKYYLDKMILWGALFLSLVLMILVGINYGVNRANTRLEADIRSKEKKIESLTKRETQQVYLTSKLAAFKDLLKTHELHQAVAETVFSLIPTGTSLKGFEVTESGIINLAGNVPDWPLFNQILANLKRKDSGKLSISRATVKQVNFSGRESISFDLELVINVQEKDI